MPKGSKALSRARETEIIDACAELYETMGFRDITIRDIGEKTTFTRTSIYNYFHTKEEIFLALLTREHAAWCAQLEAALISRAPLRVKDFAEALGSTLEKRGCMLKLMSMNLYDMETNSRIENLVAFKLEYARAFDTLSRALERSFPQMTAADRQAFLYAFFPFLFGVYPYTSHTEKQKEAMARAQVDYAAYTVPMLVQSFAGRWLAPYA